MLFFTTLLRPKQNRSIMSPALQRDIDLMGAEQMLEAGWSRAEVEEYISPELVDEAVRTLAEKC